VESEVNDLAMKATFRVQVGGADDPQSWTSSGFDEVQFLIATNAGEPLRPLDQIASGGEMSRVMLSLKVSIQKGAAKGNGSKRSSRRPTTLVFDEIDTGIGGRVSEAVGLKLKKLSTTNQVLCVTHQPQIARFADNHLVVQKDAHDGRTHVSVNKLDRAGRVEELARMLTGAEITDSARRHARELLKH